MTTIVTSAERYLGHFTRPRCFSRERLMTRKTAHDYDQELLILFDAYVHGGIDRRTFLDRA